MAEQHLLAPHAEMQWGLHNLIHLHLHQAARKVHQEAFEPLKLRVTQRFFTKTNFQTLQ